MIERDGSVLVAQPGATQVDPVPLLAMSNIDISGGERGLVGITLDPGFAGNGWFYVFYTAASPLRDRVSRFTASGNTVVPGSELVALGGQRGRSALPPRRGPRVRLRRPVVRVDR